jgi:hypothetical protein
MKEHPELAAIRVQRGSVIPVKVQGAILGKKNKLLSCGKGGGACCSVTRNCWHGPLDPATINVDPPLS